MEVLWLENRPRYDFACNYQAESILYYDFNLDQSRKKANVEFQSLSAKRK